jgi:DNA-binding CsgD family transcriptional regulator
VAWAAEASGWSIDDTIEFALEGERGEHRDASASKDDLLTRREREVADLLANGSSNRQIAAQLLVTERTVASHVEHILAKLGFSSRTRLGVWAVEHHARDSIEGARLILRTESVVLPILQRNGNITDDSTKVRPMLWAKWRSRRDQVAA